MKGRSDLLGYGGVLLLVAAGLVRVMVIGSGSLSLTLAVLGGILFLVYFFRAGASVERFLGRRSTRVGGTVLGTTLFVIGIAVLVNILAGMFRLRLDTTEDKLFTLAPETAAALRAAPEPPEVWVFYPDQTGVPERMRRILEAARDADPRLRFHIVDPRRDPVKAFEFQLQNFASVVQVGEHHEVFDRPTEEGFLAALLKASQDRAQFAGFVRGHGESPLMSTEPGGMRTAAETLYHRNFVPFNLNMLAGGMVHDSLDVMVVMGPRTELSPAEADSVRDYLNAGGGLLLALDPARGATWNRVLARVGLRFDPRFISDPDQIDPQIVHPAEIASHPVVAPLGVRRVQVAFPGVGEIVAGTAPESSQVKILYRSGKRATLAGDPSSEARSRGLAAAASWPAPGGREGRLVVFGDADFATNQYFGSLGNGDLFLAAMQWLAGRESLIELRPRSRTDRPVVLTRQQGRALMVLVVGLLPLGVLAAGSAVWWRRR